MKPNKPFKNWLFVNLLRKYPAGLTPPAAMRQLLHQLRPIHCGKDLIRLGPDGDGGYLIPDDLDGITACFSPGVGGVSGFESDCAKKGMQVFMADKSVEATPEQNESFSFIKKYVGVVTNSDFITLDDWVKASLPADQQEDLLLQMDVEGAEYEILLSVPDDLLKRFRIIAVEFHALNEWWNKPYFNLVSRLFEKLLCTHKCVHLHPNNGSGVVTHGDIEIPPVLEMSFIRNDRIINSSFAKTFPHPLDCDNNTTKPTLPLPKCWYA